MRSDAAIANTSAPNEPAFKSFKMENGETRLIGTIRLRPTIADKVGQILLRFSAETLLIADIVRRGLVVFLPLKLRTRDPRIARPPAERGLPEPARSPRLPIRVPEKWSIGAAPAIGSGTVPALLPSFSRPPVEEIHGSVVEVLRLFYRVALLNSTEFKVLAFRIKLLGRPAAKRLSPAWFARKFA